ncbi:MAG: hypothetical protein ABSH01_04650 [Terriglobia bacterium]
MDCGETQIISVAFATVADYIEPEQRSAAMAVGIIGGPILAGWFGTASLFWMTGFLGLAVFLAGTLFYIGFTGLGPILPSLVSKASPGMSYGTALGFCNTAQFLGSTVGGSLAGALANYPPERALFTMMAAAAIGFLMMVATKPPRRIDRT